MVSVILPVYNAQDYLKEAIESILIQSYHHFELIIIDDGSTDDSLMIIQRYDDARLKVIKNPKNMGLIYSLNLGLSICKGEYIARMDADDIAVINRFERQILFMENNPQVGVCGSWVQAFGRVNSLVRLPVSNDNLKIKLLEKCPFYHSSVMLRKQVFNYYGIKYNPSFNHAEDYQLWADLSGKTDFYIIPEVLLKYRTHNKNISTVYNTIQKENSFNIRELLLYQILPDMASSDIKASIKMIDEGTLDLNELLRLELIVKNLGDNFNLLRIKDKSTFLNFLKRKYWLAFTGNTHHGIQTYNIFKASSLEIKLPFYLMVKFWVKCLLRYK